MKSKEQLQQSYNAVVRNIDMFSDRLVEAMCNGDNWDEELCRAEINILDIKKDVLEWVLN